MKQFQIPDEIELIGFFGAEPIERSLEDGYWRFEIRDVTAWHSVSGLTYSSDRHRSHFP